MRLTRLIAPLFAVSLALPLAACSDDDNTTTAPVAATVETTSFGSSLGIDLAAAGWTKTSTGLYYRTVTAAPTTAATVANGQSISVRYTGYLADGTSFQTSTIPFVLGRGEVISGWDLGIVGMRVGEKRRLLIPPSLGYGSAARGPIPGNSVLVFDVELLSTT